MGRSAAMLAVLLALGATAPARAGALTVSPVTLGFEAKRKAAVIEVSNPADQPTTVQVRVFRWSQRGDQDQYEPTQDIGFSPPIFTVGPGESQLVRLLLRAPAPGATEQAYRVFIDQIPRRDAEGLQTPVRMVIPAFVAPLAPAKGALEWRIAADPASGRARLTALNTGSSRVKLENLAVVVDGERQVIAPGLSGYVLAGQSRSWRVPATGTGPTVTVTAESERKAISETVSVK